MIQIFKLYIFLNSIKVIVFFFLKKKKQNYQYFYIKIIVIYEIMNQEEINECVFDNYIESYEIVNQHDKNSKQTIKLFNSIEKFNFINHNTTLNLFQHRYKNEELSLYNIHEIEILINLPQFDSTFFQLFSQKRHTNHFTNNLELFSIILQKYKINQNYYFNIDNLEESIDNEKYIFPILYKAPKHSYLNKCIINKNYNINKEIITFVKLFKNNRIIQNNIILLLIHNYKCISIVDVLTSWIFQWPKKFLDLFKKNIFWDSLFTSVYLNVKKLFKSSNEHKKKLYYNNLCSIFRLINIVIMILNSHQKYHKKLLLILPKIISIFEIIQQKQFSEYLLPDLLYYLCNILLIYKLLILPQIYQKEFNDFINNNYPFYVNCLFEHLFKNEFNDMNNSIVNFLNNLIFIYCQEQSTNYKLIECCFQILIKINCPNFIYLKHLDKNLNVLINNLKKREKNIYIFKNKIFNPINIDSIQIITELIENFSMKVEENDPYNNKDPDEEEEDENMDILNILNNDEYENDDFNYVYQGENCIFDILTQKKL